MYRLYDDISKVPLYLPSVWLYQQTSTIFTVCMTILATFHYMYPMYDDISKVPLYLPSVWLYQQTSTIFTLCMTILAKFHYNSTLCMTILAKFHYIYPLYDDISKVPLYFICQFKVLFSLFRTYYIIASRILCHQFITAYWKNSSQLFNCFTLE